jgi:hypothetical protein
VSVFHIFPQSGFDESATTPVFLGVIISWLFTETYGWVFAGLVVPGYVATLFLLDPRVATIDVLEAVLTYVLARLLAEHLARTGWTSRFFGRERFFLIVLVSIVVRLVVEAVALPRVAAHATWAFSIGVVVVPLMANACWKTGLARGFVQNGVPTLIVYALLRFVFVPYTNLSLSGFDLATENVAASFLASPKAYILLLTGAVLAAFGNLRYGWDYSGILIPALLGLIVATPTKFLATLAEVAVLVSVARVLMRVTPLRRANIEGPRRAVFFFTLDYALRFAFAGTVGQHLGATDVVDLMGFGYLLPTLLAVKVEQKGLASLVVLPAVAVSTCAFAIGTLLGFGAHVLDPEPAPRPAVSRKLPRPPSRPAAAALWLSALARTTPPRAAAGAALPPRSYARLVDALLDDPASPLPPHLEARRIDRDVLLVRERFEKPSERLGDPAVLATPGAATMNRIVALVPAPLEAPESAALAGRLLEARAVDAVVIAGVEETAPERMFAERSASALARSLADARGWRGVVAALRRSTTDEARIGVAPRVSTDQRVLALVRKVRELAGDASETLTAPEDTEDLAIDLPVARAERWSDSTVPPLSLDNSTAIATAFDGARASATAPEAEDRLALRRLVLEPLLRANAGTRSLAVMRSAAALLGYRLYGPAPLADGDDAIALLPGTSPRPIALVARWGGVRGAVVEVPHGSHTALRDLAIQLGSGLHADAVLVGLERTGRPLDNDTLREAVAAATFPEPGREGARIVVVRDSGDAEEDGGATVGAWGGGEIAAFASDTESALAQFGIPSKRTALDFSVREEAGRSVLGDMPLVEVSVADDAARAGSLAAARSAAHDFALPVLDSQCGTAATALVAALPAEAPDAPGTLLDWARRAAVEESVVARRELETAIATTSARAALARAAAAVCLVIAGRTASGLQIGAFPTSSMTSCNMEAQ